MIQFIRSFLVLGFISHFASILMMLSLILFCYENEIKMNVLIIPNI